MMKEEFLHYIWKYKLFDTDKLETVNCEKIEIINLGSHNHDAGPDFFNAKIKINDTIWAGNIEIHINSSDWQLHNHHKDKAYDNVILQVVNSYDYKVKRTNGETIPTIEIQFDSRLLDNYETLLKNESWIPCQDIINEVDLFTVQHWMESLLVERLEDKANRINSFLNQTQNSWEEAFYIHLARNFGFKLNAEPFEQLAKSLPLKCLAKHKDNIMQLEALLFGQAGFLEDASGDNYYQNLRNEYLFLRNKFNLTAIENHLWKFLRSRPGNFPTVRIAQFAMLVFNSSALFSKILETGSVKDFYALFVVEPSNYWKNHYVFNKESRSKSKIIGKSSVDNLLINTIIPFLFVYGKSHGSAELQDSAIALLGKIKPEKNTIVTKWNELGIKSTSAFESQALIQLKNEYCNHKKCLSCHIGNYLIKYVDES